MSVLVKGIKIPVICSGCDLNYWGKCVPKKRNVPIHSDNAYHPRPEWCPLLEVPECHGDLIDRGAFIKLIQKAISNSAPDGFCEAYQNILLMLLDEKATPAIIEADMEG